MKCSVIRVENLMEEIVERIREFKLKYLLNLLNTSNSESIELLYNSVRLLHSVE